MPQIEGFRIQNYRALRDVTLGKTSTQQQREPLTPFTAVIGKNGTGKSTLFDAFGFVSDCLSLGVEGACEAHQRGGFDRLRSAGSDEPIRFELYYREAPNERPITYELAISLDRSGRPYVQTETLRQRRRGQSYGRPFPFLRLDEGKGAVWAGEVALEAAPNQEEDPSRETVELTDLRQLGIATLGTLKEHPRITGFRDFPERLVPFLLPTRCSPITPDCRAAKASERSRRQYRQCRAIHGTRAQRPFQIDPVQDL